MGTPCLWGSVTHTAHKGHAAEPCQLGPKEKTGQRFKRLSGSQSLHAANRSNRSNRSSPGCKHDHQGTALSPAAKVTSLESAVCGNLSRSYRKQTPCLSRLACSGHFILTPRTMRALWRLQPCTQRDASKVQPCWTTRSCFTPPHSPSCGQPAPWPARVRQRVGPNFWLQ